MAADQLSPRKTIWIILTCFFSFLMIRIAVPYLGLRYDVGFLLTKQSVLYHLAWRISFYVHITTSVLVLLFGGIQFTNIERRPIHRRLGKYYVAIILFAAAPTGLIMGYYANGGIWAQLSFMIAAVVWWITTYRALLLIRRGEVDRHRRMMFYSYALTLSAITLRTYALVLPFFFHLHARQMYTLIAWLGWVPNCLIAYLLLLRKPHATIAVSQR